MIKPTEPGEDWFDPDIAAMELGYGEKAGLQIYRNYSRSFEQHAIKQFVEALDQETLDLKEFEQLVKHIVEQDARFLPVIVCAFADQILKTVFEISLPKGIPGGKASMFGGYGPLSSLAKRIQLAYAFDVLSADLMLDLDRLRSSRNTISHNWNIDGLSDFFTKGPLTDMYRIEELLASQEELAAEFAVRFTPLRAFRVRLVWVAGRLVYEAAAYNRAKAVRVRPERTLYEKPAPRWLSDIARICVRATREIVNRER